MPDSTGIGRTERFQVPAQGTASTVQSTIIYECPFAGTLTGATMTSPAAVAANGTNYRTFTLYNRGTDGSGTTVMATLDTSTVGFTDNDERAMTLSATAANLEMNPGDILEMVETVASAGVAHSGFLGSISQDRDINE